MKITKKQLKQIIKEELSKILREDMEAPTWLKQHIDANEIYKRPQQKMQQAIMLHLQRNAEGHGFDIAQDITKLYKAGKEYAESKRGY
jgi:uncharacterized protein YhjY with autotransporter beta-barrel domain